MDKKKLIEILESKEMALLFLTATSYLVCYFFQLVYLEWYGIPAELIDIEINALILSLGLTAAISFVLVFYGAAYVRFEKKNSANKAKVYLSRGIVGIALFALVMFAFNVSIQGALSSIAIAVPGTLVAVFAVETYRRKSFKSAWTFFREAFKPTSSTRKQPAKEEPLEFIPERLILYLGVSVVAVFLAFASGRFYAATRSDFMVVHSDGDIKRVVIAKNGSDFVARDYDTKKRTFIEGYYIVRSRDIKAKIDDLKIIH